MCFVCEHALLYSVFRIPYAAGRTVFLRNRPPNKGVRGGGYDWVYGVCVAGRGVSKGDIGLLKVGKKFYIPETPGTPMC